MVFLILVGCLQKEVCYGYGYMGSGFGGTPLAFSKGPRPEDHHSRLKYRWSEDSVNQELPFVEITKRTLDLTQTQVQPDKSPNIKGIIRQELELLGWEYNRRATFKANFPFRHKYVVFDSTTKLDADDRFRLKVTLNRDSVSEYKLMKWVPR